MEKRTMTDEIATRQRESGMDEDLITIYMNLQNNIIEKLFPSGDEKYSVDKDSVQDTLNTFNDAIRQSLEEII